MNRVTHNLRQGTPEWDAFRLEHHGASEAAAMLGLSKLATRSELLRVKHTGLPREFSDWVQANILDYGHEVEALARPIVEAKIADDLYPVTMSLGKLSASCDGLNMAETLAFEHKQNSASLFASVAAGVLPEEHMPQCQQVMLVTGAKKLLFVVSDGTEEHMASLEVLPSPEWFARIEAGWRQFDDDLANYVQPETPVAVVAKAVTALPSVSVQVSGSIQVTSNFTLFERALRDFIDNKLIREPADDQDFADLDLQIKALKNAEVALDAAEAQMLSQVDAVDAAKRTKDMLSKLVRDNRLMAEKLLAARKESIKGEVVAGGIAAFKAHIASLNARIGEAMMPSIPADFAGVIKNKRTVASLRDSVDTELARAKIAANEVADRIAINLRALNDAGHATLFPDRHALVLKAADDLQATITSRIATHQAKEAARLEAERAAIRAEEQAKAQREAAAQAAAQEATRVAAEAEKLKALQAEQDRIIAQAAAEKRAHDDELMRNAVALKAKLEEPAIRSSYIAGLGNREVIAAIEAADERATTEPATLKLGAINERFGHLTVTAQNLADLGITHSATDKSAKLYRESDWPRICKAIAEHVHNACHEFAKVAA